IAEIETRYEKKLTELKKQHDQLEERFETARDQWRTERRALNAEIEQLQKSADSALQMAREQVSEELQSEVRFRNEQLSRAYAQLEQQFAAAHQRFEAERNNLKAQLTSTQASALDAMERSNNPARIAAAVREQLQLRLAEAKEDWQNQWAGERAR